jgi:hypothetical protein
MCFPSGFLPTADDITVRRHVMLHTETAEPAGYVPMPRARDPARAVSCGKPAAATPQGLKETLNKVAGSTGLEPAASGVTDRAKPSLPDASCGFIRLFVRPTTRCAPLRRAVSEKVAQNLHKNLATDPAAQAIQLADSAAEAQPPIAGAGLAVRARPRRCDGRWRCRRASTGS